jgi:hypothetical protein
MHTPDAETSRNGGVSGAAKQVAEHASSIARLELELAALELKKKVTAFRNGVALALGAALLGFFRVAIVFATIAAALATFLSTWLALLIVTVSLGVLAGLLAMLAVASFKKGTPPIPEQAIREAKLTTEAIKTP